MTLTPEERAKSLFPLAFGETPSATQVAFQQRIVDAIRQAQNDKLEEASAAASGALLRALDAGYDRGDTAIAAVVAIRSLKSKD